MNTRPIRLHSNLYSSLLTSFHHHYSQLKGKRIWLAISGGRDSLSLAHTCHTLFQSGDLPFLPQLLHVNHGIQSNSDAWAKQVQNWAKNHAMPCTVLTIKPSNCDEQSLRDARYSALFNRMNTDDVLLLAHHQDDQIETVLMRLFNGTGVTGLGGMTAWATRQKAEGDSVALWRPWLDISREQITTYATAQNLPFIDDPTNGYQQDDNAPATTNTRAWLRGELLPLIQTRYPQASDAIARTARLIQDAEAIISEQVQADLANVQIIPSTLVNLNRHHAEIDIQALLTLSKPRQSAVIHAWLSANNTQGQSVSPTYQTVHQVLDLCQRVDTDQHTLIHHADYRILRYRNRLYRLQADWLTWLQSPWQPSEFTLLNNIDKTLALTKSPQNFVCQCYLNGQAFEQILPQVAPYPSEDLKLTFAPYCPSQSVTLYGRTGSKRGKKLAQALGIPRFMRASLLIVSLSNDKQTTPLCLIHPYGSQLLQSPYVDAIIQTMSDMTKKHTTEKPSPHHQVVMQIGYAKL